MLMTDLGADECLDPALMSAFKDNPSCQWHCTDAPPSPFDMSTIDPDLLALYPEQNGGVDLPAASPPLIQMEVEAQDCSASPPPLQDEPSAIAMTTEDDTESRNPHDSPRPKRVRSASLPPHDPPAPAPERQVERRATRAHHPRRLSAPLPKKYSALGSAKRTISDGTLVPPSRCARCSWEGAECLIKYPGAACNVCRRRGRRCELVDERGKFNGQRAKDLRAAETAFGK